MRTERPASRRRRIPFLVALGSLAVFAAPSRAQQTFEPILKVGDYILGAGSVQFVSKLAVTDRGLPLIEVVFNAANNAKDIGVLRNGFLSILESTPVLVPGGSIKTFDDLSVDRYGNVAWPLTLQGTPGGSLVDSGVYWNTVNLLVEQGPCRAPQVPATAFYLKFEAVRMNNSGGLLVIGDYNDAPMSPGEDGIFLLQTDGEGNLLSESIVVRDGETFPPFTTTVAQTGFAPNSIALNDRNDWMSQIVATVSGAVTSANDTGILLNGVVVAREGDPAPVPPIPNPRKFSDMRDPELDINDFGEYVFNCILDVNVNDPISTGSNALLVRGNLTTGNQKWVQEGNTFSAITPFNLLQFDSAPIQVANSGDIFWYARTNNGATSQDQLLFRNFTTLVQEGVTVIDGDIVSGVRGTESSFHVSRSGRFWISEVTLQNSGDAVIMADFGTIVPVPGCLGNQARLTRVLGDARAGQTFSLQMDQSQALGAIPLLFFSTKPALSDSVISCGIPTKFGEILIGLGAGQLQGRLRGGPFTGIPTLFNISVPNDPALVDLIYWTQGMFWDVPKTSGQGIRLTNGMYIEIGA